MAFKCLLIIDSSVIVTRLYQVRRGTVKTDRSGEKTIHRPDKSGRSEISTSTRIDFNQYQELLHLAC